MEDNLVYALPVVLVVDNVDFTFGGRNFRVGEKKEKMKGNEELSVWGSIYKPISFVRASDFEARYKRLFSGIRLDYLINILPASTPISRATSHRNTPFPGWEEKLKYPTVQYETQYAKSPITLRPEI